jgi:oligoribonuclease NrnB/cAMP/cGMP phosphodiesterase (DHH superfamily)
MARSGAGIAWDYLSSQVFPPDRFEKVRRPWLVDYIEDRDLWRQALPRTREVSAYIASLPMTFEEWDTLSATPWKAVADKGAAVQRYIDTYGAKAREMARVEGISGHRVPTINLPYMNCSEHVGALAEEYPDAPFAAGYFRRADGRWQFSLRSRDGFDVSAIAKVFGGGGHVGAAGFDVDRLPWEIPHTPESPEPAEEEPPKEV